MQRPRKTLFLGLFFVPAPRYIPRLDKFSSVRVGTYGIRVTNRSAHVGAYCIRPTNAYDNRQMIQPPGTCWGVCFCALPIPIKNLIPIYWMNLKPGRFWGVCFCALPIPIKNLIPIYWINLKPGGFWDVCLCDQPRPGEKLLKFVWMHAKPGEDWMKMAIFTRNPAGIERIWPYLSKIRRGLDENGHIHRKPGGDWTNMAIFTENPARIGRIWPYLPKTRRELDGYGHIHRKPGGDWIQYGYSYRILAGNRIPYVFGNHIFGKDEIREPTCRLYLFYIGMQMARTGVNVSRQECRATHGMRSAVCVRQSFMLRFPSLAHSPSPSYC